MKKVTDPELLKQLNADEAPTLKRVTDPAILAQLNSDKDFEAEHKKYLQSQLTSGMTPTASPLPRTPGERTWALNIGALLTPSVRAAKYLPDTSHFLTKAATNYAGSIGQNAAIGAGMNAYEGESPGEGALTGGGVTAAVHPLAAMAASGNPFTRAISMGLLGGGIAYGLHQGEKEGSSGIKYADIAAAIAGGALGMRGKNAKESALLNMLKGVKPEDAAPRLEAAERLKLKYLTPAEATGHPHLGSKQGSVGQTPEGSTLLYEKSQERLNSEQSAIKNLINTIGTSKTLGKEISQKYQKAYESSVSSEFLDKLKESSTLRAAFKATKNDPAYQDQVKHLTNNKFIELYHGSPNGNIGREGLTADRYASDHPTLTNDARAADEYGARKMANPEYDSPNLYKIKIPLKDAEKYIQKEDLSEFIPKLRGREDSQLFGVKQKIPADYISQVTSDEFGKPINKIDINAHEKSFEYLDQVKRSLDDMQQVAKSKGKNNKARLIGEKRDLLIKQMDELNPAYTEARALAQRAIVSKQMKKQINKAPLRGTNFFKAFLQNPDKFNELNQKLKNVPEAQRQLSDMRLAFEHLINPDSPRSAAKLKSTFMSDPKGLIKEGLKYLGVMQGGHYDKAAIELISNPKWAEEIRKIPELNSNSAKTQALANLISRAASFPVREVSKKNSPMILELNKYKGYEQDEPK